MDLHRLEVFLKVVDLKSFTKAGEALLLSQPTVSEHLRLLEEMVGEKLVDRLGREILPTPAGQVLYDYARRMLQLKDAALQALANFKGHLSGRLLLGASTIPGTYILPPLIGAFKSRHPAIHLILQIASTADIAAAVLKGDVEIGLVGFRLTERRLKFLEIFTDELVLAVYPEHPWAHRGSVSLAELAEQPYIARLRGSGTQMVINRFLEEHGFNPARLAVVAEMASTEAVRQAIKARLGISILSRYAVAEDLEHGALGTVDLADIRFFRPFYLCQRLGRQLSPLGEAFLNFVLEQAPQKTDGAEK